MIGTPISIAWSTNKARPSSFGPVTTAQNSNALSSTKKHSGRNPEGDRYLVRFALDPFPVWQYETRLFGSSARSVSCANAP